MKRTGIRGFTLIELMIVVAIAAILAAVAMPAYLSQVRKNRRNDAFSAISQVVQAEERWRAEHTDYTGTIDAGGLGLSSTSKEGYYTLGISSASSTGYTVTATAVAGKSQASDSGCTPLTMTVSNTGETPSPHSCWTD